MACACLQRSLFYRAALNSSDTGWDTDDHARTGKDGIVAGFLDKNLQHTCGDVKVRNNTVLERTNCYDRARCSADNILCFLTHIFDGIISGIHCNHRWLSHDDSFSFHEYQCIGCTQINADVFSKHNLFSSCQNFKQLRRSSLFQGAPSLPCTIVYLFHIKFI